MLVDCQRIFKKEYDKHGDRLLIDSWVPKDGTYFLVKISNDNFELPEEIDIKFNKKIKECIYSNQRKAHFIRTLDYYSNLLEMNKPIDSKKCIHSCNFLSFFIKKENIKKKNLTTEIIEGYYNILKEPRKKYANKKKTMMLYNKVENEIGIPDATLISGIEEWIKNNVFDLVTDLEKKDYLKIFFYYDSIELTKDIYKNEYQRYVFPNLYNSNDFNTEINGEIYGLPNDNMKMNSKKPFLGHKNRGMSEIPYCLNLDDALMQKRFFDYLMNAASKGECNIYLNKNNEDEDEKTIMTLNEEELPNIDFSGYYLRANKGTNEAEIYDFQIVPSFNATLKTPIKYRKYFDRIETAPQKKEKTGLKKKKKEVKYKYRKNQHSDIYIAKDLQGIINDVFFYNYLVNNYFTPIEDLSITDRYIKRNIIFSRNSIWKWVRSGAKPESQMARLFESVADRAIKGSLNNNYGGKAMDQFCLKQSLKQYFNYNSELEDRMLQIGDKLKELVIKNETWSFEDDESYYYAIGQLVQYFLSRSRASKKSLSVINPYLNAKSYAKIKVLLVQMFKNYSYDMSPGSRAGKMLASVLAYTPKGKVNKDFILQGFLDTNVIYTERKDKNEEK